MRDLGMAVEDQDASTGFIFAKGPAPKPLTEQEWERAKAIDKPILKSYSAFMFHTTQGTEYAINVITLSQEQGGIEVSLGIRMVRGKPPTGTIYGTAPPPIAVSMIIDKVWEHFERVVAQQSGTLGDVSVPKT